MALLVLKFGGTSVGTPDRIRQVAARVARERRGGRDVVTVVSAMGHTTDELLDLAGRVTADARRRHPRELDMLLTAGERMAMALTAMAIRDLGVEAVSLTGSQAAIITNERHTGARIEEVRATRVREELANGKVVIVAGFQGVSRAREVTTLGRGGSDTTAVALAAALGAERCDIFTDVDGVFTADPRKVRGTRLIERIDYQEMVELATCGAQVLHPRAVEIGARFRVPIRVLSAFRDEDNGGTLVTQLERGGMEGLMLTAVTCESDYAQLVLRGLSATTAATARVLTALADAGISLETVVQADRADGRRQLQITLPEEGVEQAAEVCRGVVAELGGESVDTRVGLSRVVLVGSGMHGTPGVYARAFGALMAAGVEVHALSASSISITFVVDTAQAELTLQLLHDVFGLGEGAA